MICEMRPNTGPRQVKTALQLYDREVVPTPRLERGTPRSTIWCSNQLSYVGPQAEVKRCLAECKSRLNAPTGRRQDAGELERGAMGINDDSETSAGLQIGPTTLGMVRLYIETETLELPLDFDPDEAEEIAEELRAAAARAREARAARAGGRPGGAGTPPEPAEKARGGSGRRGGGRPPQGGPKRRRGSGSSS
jgi:hypothetical protein